MITKLPETIRTESEARLFLKSLFDNHELYHPRENALHVTNILTGKPTFTRGEAYKLNSLMAEVQALPDFDIDYFCLTLVSQTLEF